MNPPIAENDENEKRRPEADLPRDDDQFSTLWKIVRKEKRIETCEWLHKMENSIFRNRLLKAEDVLLSKHESIYFKI